METDGKLFVRQRPELRHVSSDRDGKGATGAGADK